jgi:hypothetical protein
VKLYTKIEIHTTDDKGIPEIQWHLVEGKYEVGQSFNNGDDRSWEVTLVKALDTPEQEYCPQCREPGGGICTVCNTCKGGCCRCPVPEPIEEVSARAYMKLRGLKSG